MSLIDNAVAHFNAKETRTLEVPQWGTTLYAKNLSLQDKAKWLNKANGNTTDYLLYAVIYGVESKDGEAEFSLEDKIKLRRKVDPEVLSKVANFVLAADGADEDEREKN